MMIEPAHPNASAPSRRSASRADVALLLAVLLLGLLNLPQPFGWDQALFTIGARKLYHGAVFYRDFWDVKQPGIYLFYWLGGALFGFNETGIHAFELLYLIGFALLMRLALRDYFDHRWAGASAALLTIGWFYAVTTDWHLTQIEGLVGPPVFFTLWFSWRATRPQGRGRDLVLSGAMGGVVAIFKLGLLPLPALFWLAALVRPRGGAATHGAAPVRGVLLIACGAALTTGPLLVWLAAHHVLRLAWWTSVSYPAAILHRMTSLRLKVLLDGFSWFATEWGPLIALAFVGAAFSLKHRIDLLTLDLLLWCVAGFGLILAQRWSYWPYQYLLLMIPVGVLAARGLDVLAPIAERLGIGARAARAALLAGLLLLFARPIGTAGLKALHLVHHHLALASDDRLRFQRGMSRDDVYRRYLDEVAFLSLPGAKPGALYVMGSPLYNWLADRDQPVSRCGGILTQYATAEDWEQTADQLARTRPPYALLTANALQFIARDSSRFASVLDLVARDYREIRRGTQGIWYERRSLDVVASPPTNPVVIPNASPASGARAPTRVIRL